MTFSQEDQRDFAAVESLAAELNKLCGNQPSHIVMCCLAMLVAYGLVEARDQTHGSEEEALCNHIDFVRDWMRRLKLLKRKLAEQEEV